MHRKDFTRLQRSEPGKVPGLRASVPLAALLFLTLLSGCSRVALVYHTSDIIIEYYVDDYLELDRSQLDDWRPILSTALSHHRLEELPYLATFFDTAHQGTLEGFGRDLVSCLIDQFEDLYRRHFRIAVGLAAPLLATLTPEQIRQLEAKFDEEAADEARQDAAAEARRDRKRAQRYAEAMNWWFGSLTDAQHRIVEDVTAAMPDTAARWEAYRNAKRGQLIALLDRSAGEGQLLAFLDDWLVAHQDLPADLRRARLVIREQIVELFVRMNESLSGRQRTHFGGRLATIRDDFMSLQKRPHLASARCASPG